MRLVAKRLYKIVPLEVRKLRKKKRKRRGERRGISRLNARRSPGARSPYRGRLPQMYSYNRMRAAAVNGRMCASERSPPKKSAAHAQKKVYIQPLGVLDTLKSSPVCTRALYGTRVSPFFVEEKKRRDRARETKWEGGALVCAPVRAVIMQPHWPRTWTLWPMASYLALPGEDGEGQGAGETMNICPGQLEGRRWCGEGGRESGEERKSEKEEWRKEEEEKKSDKVWMWEREEEENEKFGWTAWLLWRSGWRSSPMIWKILEFTVFSIANDLFAQKLC